MFKNRLITEKYGLNDDIVNITHEIIKKLKTIVQCNIVFAQLEDDEPYIKSIDINNDWIKTVQICIRSYNKSFMGAFVQKSINFIENNKYTYLVIIINNYIQDKRDYFFQQATNNSEYYSQALNEKYIDLLEEVLIHELTHAYEAYNKFLKHNKILTTNIKKLDRNFIQYKPGYSINISMINEDIMDVFRQFVYYYSKHEVNAYSTSFKYKLNKQDPKKFKSIRHIYNFIKYETQFHKYLLLMLTVKELFYNIKSYSDEYNLSEDFFLESLNKVCKYNFKSMDQVKKYVKKNIQEISNRFSKLIPKIIYEYIDINNLNLPKTSDNDYKGFKNYQEIDKKLNSLRFIIKDFKI